MRLSSPSTSVVNRVCCSPYPFLHPWKSTPKTAQILTASWYTYEFSWFSTPLHNQTLVAPYVTTILLKKHITDVTRFNINTLAQKSLSHSLFLSYQLPFFLLHTSTLLSFQTDWTSSLKAESSRTTSLLFPLHHSWDTTSHEYLLQVPISETIFPQRQYELHIWALVFLYLDKSCLSVRKVEPFYLIKNFDDDLLIGKILNK